MRPNFFRWAAIAALFLSSVGNAWDDHFRLTRAALDSVLGDERVAYVELDTALKALGDGPADGRALNAWLKIQKGWKYPNKLDERPGKKIDALAVVSTYSDEPDWGLDQNLFDADQYPEAWREELKYITQKQGLKSQGWRHMYFPGKFLWTEPIGTFQIPMRPLGEAPKRGEIYFDLARRLFEKKQPYWGYRFLGWSLHFVQDLFQPFHARQTPSKNFMCFRWKFPFLDIAATAETIGYYHFSYEHWENRNMQDEQGALAVAIEGREPYEKFSLPAEQFILDEVVGFSSPAAGELGALTWSLFPRFDPRAGIKAEDWVGKPPWWKAVEESGKDFAPLDELTRRLFVRMGAVTRRLTQEALGKRPE